MKKPIVYVHGSANMYGASRSLLRLVTRLPEPYTPVVVLTEDGPLHGALKQAGIKTFILPWLHRNVLGRHAFRGFNLLNFVIFFLPNIVRFAAFLRQQNADLVHTNNSTVIVPACSAYLARIPHVWHIRETLDEYTKLWDRFAETETSLIWKWSSYLALRIWSWYVRFIYFFSTKVVCVSEVVCKPFIKLGLTEKSCVVNDGLEIPYYTDPTIKKLSLDPWLQDDEEFFFLGTIGEIRMGKGQLFLIDSFARFKEKYPETRVKCLLIGGNKEESRDYLQQLEDSIKEKNLEKDVIWCGEIPDPRPGFARLDLFVLSSIQPEPFGNVVLEAMVMKVPVIGTAIGGTPEQIEDGQTGILVPPDDQEQLADAIATMVLNPKKRLSFMGNAFEKAIALYDVDIHVKNIVNIYESCLKNRQ